MLKLELKKSEESRNELQMSIKETTQELKNENFNNLKNFNKLMTEKVEVDEKLKELSKKLENSVQNYENSRNLSNSLQGDLREIRIQLKNFEYIKNIKLFLMEI